MPRPLTDTLKDVSALASILKDYRRAYAYAISRNITTATQKSVLEVRPRDALLLPVKDKIKAYLQKGITKTLDQTTSRKRGCTVSESSLLSFYKRSFWSPSQKYHR